MDERELDGPARRGRRLAAGLAVSALAAGALGSLLTGRQVRDAEARFPRLGRTIEVEGLEQHVLEAGSGRAVVFVHGAFGALQDYVQTILPEVSRRYRCVLWDRPGHGYSERPDGPVDPTVQAHLLRGVIDELGLEQPLLVGFSYGGAVALATALEFPDRIGGLLLLNAPTHPWPGSVELAYRLPRFPVLGTLLTETWMPVIAQWSRGESEALAFDPMDVPPHFAASPIDLALRPASLRANAEDMRVLNAYLAKLSRRYGPARGSDRGPDQPRRPHRQSEAATVPRSVATRQTHVPCESREPGTKCCTPTLVRSFKRSRPRSR